MCLDTHIFPGHGQKRIEECVLLCIYVCVCMCGCKYGMGRKRIAREEVERWEEAALYIHRVSVVGEH